jgi:opacity protein-like surface antigen
MSDFQGKDAVRFWRTVKFALGVVLAMASSSRVEAQNCAVGGLQDPSIVGLLPNLATGGGPAAGALVSVLGTMNTAFLTQTNAFIGAVPNAPAESTNGGAWIRSVGGYTDTKSDVTTNARFFSPAPAPQDLNGSISCKIKTHLEYAGFQIGQDFGKLNVAGWSLHGGATAGYMESNVKENNLAFSGNFQTPFVGLYAAATKGGFFIDGLLRADFYQNHITYPSGGLADQAFNARALTFSSSTGYNFAVGSWFVEPSLGVIYSSLSSDSISSAGAKYSVSGANGNDTPGTVSFNRMESLLGRAGLRVGTTFNYGSLVLNPFVSVSAWHEFAGDVNAPFATCVSCAFRGDQPPGVHIPVTLSGNVSASRVGTYGQYALGVTGQIVGSGWLGYARVDLKEGTQIEGVGVNAGLRYQFNPMPAAAPKVGKGPLYKAPPLPQSVAHNWTGFYVGGFTGVNWGSAQWSSLDNGSAIGNHFGGLLGGLGAGYNFQVGPWVYGFEGDFGWTNARGARTSPNGTDGTVFTQGIGPSPFAIGSTPICTTRIDISCQNSLDSLATFTGRLGYAWDRILVYAKGGGAWMSGNNRTFDNYFVNGSIIPNLGVGPICHCVLGSASDNRFGWALGAGLEYAYSSNWSVKMEYLYLGFGSRQLTFSDGERWKISDNFSEVKLGINYHFSR